MKTFEAGKTRMKNACEHMRNAFKAMNPLTEKNKDRAIGVVCGVTALTGVPMGVVLTIDAGSSGSSVNRLGALGMAFLTAIAVGVYEAIVVERLLKTWGITFGRFERKD